MALNDSGPDSALDRTGRYLPSWLSTSARSAGRLDTLGVSIPPRCNMNLHQLIAAAVLCVAVQSATIAQVPVRANSDHAALLASTDPKLAENKRLVYDFWREVFEAGHMEFADKYMAESYVQHNPNVPTGRSAFVEFFTKFKKPKPIETKVSAALVSITAEGNIVVLSFVRELADPKDSSKTYTTTWFDMFRIENGKIAEHWDPAQKQ